MLPPERIHLCPSLKSPLLAGQPAHCLALEDGFQGADILGGEQGGHQRRGGQSGMGPKAAGQPTYGVWGRLETKLPMFAPERPSEGPTCLLANLTGVFSGWNLNSQARSRGKPRTCHGVANVTAAIQPVLNSN